MVSIHVAQSAPLCIVLSAVGGAIEVLATAVLAYQDADERSSNVRWSRSATYCALASNVTLQVASSVIGNLVATWFGPVSLVGPIYLSSQLLVNMVVFGSVLGLECFNKDMKVGTYVVVIAVVLLPIVGPAVIEDEEEQSGAVDASWYALAWGGLQVGIMFLSAACLVLLDVPKLREAERIALLLVARATAFTVNLTVSKLFVLEGVGAAILVAALALKITSGMIITYALVLQSTVVPQAKFAPLNASALILVNAITGLIIWEDWRVIGSWVGYGCVFVQLVLGNYLLLGDVDLLSADNAQFGRAKEVSMMTRSIGLRRERGSRHLVIDGETDGAATGGGGELADNTACIQPPSAGGNGRTEEGGSSIEGQYIYWGDEDGTGSGEDKSLPTNRRGRRTGLPGRASTRREAWSSVYGINDAFGGSTGRHRRRSIFVIDADELSELQLH